MRHTKRPEYRCTGKDLQRGAEVFRRAHLLLAFAEVNYLGEYLPKNSNPSFNPSRFDPEPWR